jgi:CheY-like chemotaxis protein
MPITVLLAVGREFSQLKTKRSEWKSAGYIVAFAESIKKAIDHFTSGDFDLVLLDNSISDESGRKLTSLIRASGSRIPVVCIEDSSCDCDAFVARHLRIISEESGNAGLAMCQV